MTHELLNEYLANVVGALAVVDFLVGAIYYWLAGDPEEETPEVPPLTRNDNGTDQYLY